MLFGRQTRVSPMNHVLVVVHYCATRLIRFLSMTILLRCGLFSNYREQACYCYCYCLKCAGSTGCVCLLYQMQDWVHIKPLNTKKETSPIVFLQQHAAAQLCWLLINTSLIVVTNAVCSAYLASTVVLVHVVLFLSCIFWSWYLLDQVLSKGGVGTDWMPSQQCQRIELLSLLIVSRWWLLHQDGMWIVNADTFLFLLLDLYFLSIPLSITVSCETASCSVLLWHCWLCTGKTSGL